jgi:hypothetical protein
MKDKTCIDCGKVGHLHGFVKIDGILNLWRCRKCNNRRNKKNETIDRRGRHGA